MRPSGLSPDQMRVIEMIPGFTRHAEGSCLIKFGDTHVLCNASVEERLPPWLRGKGQGWVPAAYVLMPPAPHTRSNRDAAKGKTPARKPATQPLHHRPVPAALPI